MNGARGAGAGPAAARAVMAASGFAGLGWQVVWTQQGALWLGHESAAVLAVVTAFFGGLALGAGGLGARIERSARPARWYVACEVLIAAWGALLVLLLPGAGRWLGAVAGTDPSPAWQWALAFGGSFVLLLPATVAMGATLPAMQRLLADVRQLAPLYAANTAGAVLGVLGCAFVLVPQWGLSATALACAGLNLLCALAVRGWRGAARSVAPPVATSPLDPALLRLAWSGFLGIGFEVAVVRVLSQVCEDTVYTFALLLAVYLAGTALGAAAWRGLRSGRWPLAMALAAAAGAASLWAAEPLRQAFPSGVGMGAALAGEAALALLAFGLPAAVMGTLFARLAAEAGAQGIGLGRALAHNTLGAALAPLLVGVVALPALGAKAVLVGLALGYLLLLPRAAWSAPLALPAAALAAAALLLLPPLRFADVPEGGRLLRYDEGAFGAVSIVEDAEGVSRLYINNRQQEGSSATLTVDGRQALLPLLLHPAPRQALFLGLGTGVTASVAALDPQVSVTAVELLPEVIAAAPHFTQALGAPPLVLHAADARRWVRASHERFDLIVADNFHPARSGSGALYTVEHFRAVGDRLAEGGVFCQWLPLHQLDLATLQSIVAAFVTAFPQGQAVLASHSLATPVIGLVARQGGGGFDVAALERRRTTSPLDLAAFGLDDPFAVLGSVIAGPAALARFAAGAPVNTDDRPVVAYRAPRATYAPAEAPQQRLLDLLARWQARPDEVLAPGDADYAARLAAYWRARDRYLQAGRNVQPSADPRRMLAQVGAPLLGVLAESPDFRPAAEPLRRLAGALARSDPDAARTLLARLDELQRAGARCQAGTCASPMLHQTATLK